MFVKEEIVRATEQRAVDHGITDTVRPSADGTIELDVSEALVGYDVESAAATVAAGGVAPRIRIQTKALPRRPRFVQQPSADVVQRVHHAKFEGGVPSESEFERFIGKNDLVDENYLGRALIAAKPVCRLVFRDRATGRQAYATGFMVSPQLLLTN